MTTADTLMDLIRQMFPPNLIQVHTWKVSSGNIFQFGNPEKKIRIVKLADPHCSGNDAAVPDVFDLPTRAAE